MYFPHHTCPYISTDICLYLYMSLLIVTRFFLSSYIVSCYHTSPPIIMCVFLSPQVSIFLYTPLPIVTWLLHSSHVCSYPDKSVYITTRLFLSRNISCYHHMSLPIYTRLSSQVSPDCYVSLRFITRLSDVSFLSDASHYLHKPCFANLSQSPHVYSIPHTSVHGFPFMTRLFLSIHVSSYSSISSKSSYASLHPHISILFRFFGNFFMISHVFLSMLSPSSNLPQLFSLPSNALLSLFPLLT